MPTLPSYMSSKEEDNNRQSRADADSWDCKYQRTWGWLVFFVAFLFANVVIWPFICSAYSINKIQFDRIVEPAGYGLYDIYLKSQDLMTSNATSEEKAAQQHELEVEAERLHKVIDTAEENHQKGGNYLLMTSTLQFGLLAIIIGVVIFFRKTKAVKSRGKYFLIQLISMSSALFLCNLLYALHICGKIEASALHAPDFSNIKAYWAYEFYIYYFMFFFQYMVLSAVCCRSRMVYLAFTQTNFKMNVFEYSKPIVIHVLLWLLASIPYVLNYAKGQSDNIHIKNLKFYEVLLVLVLGIFLICGWILFYSWKCRAGASRFSDFYINIRFVVYTSLCYFVYLVVERTIPPQDNLEIVFLFFAMAFPTYLYFLDQFSSLGWYFYTQEYLVTRSSKSGTSKTNCNETSQIETKVELKTSRDITCSSEDLAVVTEDIEQNMFCIDTNDESDFQPEKQDRISTNILSMVSISLPDPSIESGSNGKVYDGYN